MKTCPRCEQAKTKEEFGKHANRKDGLQVYCSACMTSLRQERQYDKRRWIERREFESARNKAFRIANRERLRPYDQQRQKAYRAANPGVIRARNIARKHLQLQATPAWASMAEINAVYLEARRLQELDGIPRHVDHVVPLKGRGVCGLHVEFNLQILTAAENMSKHNKWAAVE